MKRQCLQFLTLASSLLLLLPACRSGEQPVAEEIEQLSAYFLQEHNLRIDSTIQSVFILREDGCIPCNKAFSQLIQNNINHPSALFVIAARGLHVDISGFDETQPNVFFDKTVSLTKYPIFDESKAYFISDHQVDTVVRLNASRLSDDLDFIQKSIGLH